MSIALIAAYQIMVRKPHDGLNAGTFLLPGVGWKMIVPSGQTPRLRRY